VSAGAGAGAGDGAVVVVGADAGVDAAVLGLADFLVVFEDVAGSFSTLFVTSGVGVWEAEVPAAAFFLAAADLGPAVTFLGFVSAAGVAKAAALFSNLAVRDWGHFLPVATWQGWHGHSL
jgi:hypothetical protein